MTDRSEELEAAAIDIDPASLQAAKSAIAANCREYVRWAGLFSRRLEIVKPGELHKFARAFSLTLLGNLPTRPETCPFCIKYGKDLSCQGCGYAVTHGRCDEEDSAFSLFIEAFQELGKAIYQDMSGLKCHPDDARRLIDISILISCDFACRMGEDLPSASTRQLMELKAAYLDQMIKALPLELLSEEIEEKRLAVQRALMNYW